MQVQYAAENLTPIPADHFLARKANDLPALKIQLKGDPAGVMRNILESLGGKATPAQISSWCWATFSMRGNSNAGGTQPRNC
jgi:hypothetical protein